MKTNLSLSCHEYLNSCSAALLSCVPTHSLTRSLVALQAGQGERCGAFDCGANSSTETLLGPVLYKGLKHFLLTQAANCSLMNFLDSLPIGRAQRRSAATGGLPSLTARRTWWVSAVTLYHHTTGPVLRLLQPSSRPSVWISWSFIVVENGSHSLLTITRPSSWRMRTSQGCQTPRWEKRSWT